MRAGDQCRVLELGCGTGLLARYLAGTGYAYSGVDISHGMLALARRRVPGGNFLQCDMRDLSPLRAVQGGLFDAVICTGRAFAHLTTDAEVRACLAAVFKLLRPGGVFACDAIDAGKVYPDPVKRVSQSTPVGTREFRRDFTHAHVPGEGTTLLTTVHWQVCEGGAVIAEFDDAIRHRAFSPGEMAGFLAAAGLRGNLACSHLPHLPDILLASACKVEA